MHAILVTATGDGAAPPAVPASVVLGGTTSSRGPLLGAAGVPLPAVEAPPVPARGCCAPGPAPLLPNEGGAPDPDVDNWF
jgi:hypothetical protein